MWKIFRKKQQLFHLKLRGRFKLLFLLGHSYQINLSLFVINKLPVKNIRNSLLYKKDSPMTNKSAEPPSSAARQSFNCFSGADK